ncbi:hypothetical protein BGZ76_007710 [Entomortierella beljakovae]|nr:hypothetical protein BGZ76_007710 [Entomortierella beljakovae]
MDHADEESNPTINIAPFVRCLHVEDDHPEFKLPYSYTQFGAVLMVDIVGFSQMTSIASSKGDVGAEMLSSQIGAYFDIAIRIIEYHGGDVVKFLGDALLVAFQADPPSDCLTDNRIVPSIPEDATVAAENAASALKRNKMTVRRAIECSQELLARLSDYKIYLSEREFSRKHSCSSSGSEEHIHEDDNNSGCPSTSAINGAQGNTFSGGHANNAMFLDPTQSGEIANYQSRSRFSSTSSLGLTGSTSSRRSSLTDPSPSQRANMDLNSIGVSHIFGHHKHHKKQPSWHAGGANNLSIHPFHVGPGPNSGSDRNTNTSPTKLAANPFPFQRTREDSISSNVTTSRSKLKGRLSQAFGRFTRSGSNERNGGAVAEVLHENVLMPKDSIELKLHMALSAGEISNVIIGDVGIEHGIDVQIKGRLEYAICSEQMATLEDALNLAHAGEITLTQSIWKYANAESIPKYEPRDNCIILKQGPASDINLPVPRRVRNDKLLNTPVASNQHYFKYLNRSAIHRLILYPDGTFPAQFRNATILFVSLGEVKPWITEDLAICQRAMQLIQKLISKYEGFIQQFAVDDKGATFLCAFGLPYPRSHENEAIFATKTAWLIRKALLANDIRGFKISLATGVIFTSSIGNEFRRDPAIAGDTIVVAVRILKFDYAKESIVCDDATMHACTADHDGLCSFEYMGEEIVKGKTQPIPVWRLTHFGARQQVHRPDDIMIDETIGYEPERDKVFNFVNSWAKNPDKNTILVMGPRGSGKCLFYQQISHIAEERGYRLCVARTAEVEQGTEYFPIRFLMLSFLQIMLSEEIPYSTSRTIPSSGTQSMNWKDYFEFKSSASHLNLCSDPLLFPKEAYSPSINQYSDTFGSDSKKQTKLQGIISLCLAKLGYRGTTMSMVEIEKVISAISSENLVVIQKPEEDRILADFIVNILNYASQFVKIIVILEDTQWSDFKTLDMMKIIHERCPEVLIVLFSRPQRDYGSNSAMKALASHPNHLSITLEGLKPWEIEQALLRAFKPNGVNRISPEVMELVQEQTKGNPKFVKSMSMMLKEYYHVNVVNGELLITGKGIGPSGSEATEEMLQKQDRKKVTLMQYDRISPKFQDFLKVATCLGENFSLAEIAAIKSLSHLLGQPDSKNSYAAAIRASDTFKFLSLATDQQTNIQFSTNSGLQTIYTFRSPSTALDIYDSIPYEERVVYHLRMAQFYESFLESQPQCLDPTEKPLICQDLFPKICSHYLKTDATEKKIKYLKILASFYLKSNMLTESIEKIDRLITILDTEADAERTVNQEDLAEIYGMKGESLSKGMQIEEAEVALRKSLEKYGISWPATKSQMKRELMREGLKFKYYFHRGLVPVGAKSGKKQHQFKGDPKEQQRLIRIIRVLSCIQNTYYWATDNDSAMLATLYTLKLSRKLGVPSSDQTTSLARIAMLHYLHGHKHECGKLMAEARRRNEAGETTGGMLEAIEAFIEYNEEHMDNAHRLLDIAISESKTFGVVTHLATFYRAVTQKIAYRIWDGAFSDHQDDWQLLRTLSVVAMQNGGSEGETLFAIPTVSSLLIQNRLREAESWVFLIERFILPNARLINLVTVFGILAYYYAKVRNYQRSRIYIELHSQKIEEQPFGAHPFPLLSCMFSIMAMFEIYNSSWVPPDMSPQTTLPINMSHTLVIIQTITTFLHADPQKLVSNPLICLAETMKCFLSSSHKSCGVRRLIHTYHEFGPSLDGVKFIKAYLLAQIARNCDPEHMHNYHSQAQKLFDSMSVCPEAWLSDSTCQNSDYNEENQLDVLSDNTVFSIENSNSEDDLGWMKTRDTLETEEFTKSFEETTLGTTTRVSEIRVSQDETINHDMKMSSGVELDEGSFGNELAAASIASAPTVHNLHETPEQGGSIQGSATPA